MSREKMLQAEIALKDEQFADLTKEVERLRRQLEGSENYVQTANASETKIAELKQTIGKLAPAAKKTVQYAAELNEARRGLAVAERERSEFSKNYAATQAQTTRLKKALAEVQKDVRILDDKRKNAVKQVKETKTAAKSVRKKSLIMIIVAALLFVASICGSYLYVKATLEPPAELSEEAATAFKQYAAEYRLVVERAAQNERDKLSAERTRLAAERRRYEELNENTVWDNVVSYAWLALIFGGGFVIGVITIVAAFVFWMR